jgi:VIT1/CCC1 family predicted Fe2+/Mn2+ transporter
VLRAIKAHLGSRQVSRVIYGAIVGLALIVALEEHPPSSGVVVATLLGTALAVGLAEFYSDIIGTETRTRRHVRRAELPDMIYDVAAVAYGVAFPAVFFVLAAADAIEEDSAFTIAKWSGLGLIAVYGFCASRLAGDSVSASTLRALAAGLIGAVLIGLKALVH